MSASCSSAWVLWGRNGVIAQGVLSLKLNGWGARRRTLQSVFRRTTGSLWQRWQVAARAREVLKPHPDDPMVVTAQQCTGGSL